MARRKPLTKSAVLAELCPTCESESGFACISLQGNGDLVKPHKARREAAHLTRDGGGEPSVVVARTPPTGPTGDEIIRTLLQWSLDGRSAVATEIRKYDRGEKTRITSDRIKMTHADAEPLVEAGLVEYQSSGRVGWTLTQAGIRHALPHVKYTQLDLNGLMEHALDLAYFHPADELDGVIAIPALYKAGTSKLVLVLGENAGGKSFFRRIIQGLTHRGRKNHPGRRDSEPGPFPVHELVHLSMEGRTGGGFGSSMVYGTENYRSTGENSTNTVRMGIKTACERPHPTIIYWDEPDIGMAAGAAMGAGIAIRTFINEDSPLVQAAFVTSHSPQLVEQLALLDPHYIYLGNADGPPTLDDWFEAQKNPHPVLPEELMKLSTARFRAIQKLLNRKKS